MLTFILSNLFLLTLVPTHWLFRSDHKQNNHFPLWQKHKISSKFIFVNMTIRKRWKWIVSSYCKWNTFYFLGKMLPEPMTKNAPSNSNKNPRKPPRRKPRFDTQSTGKGGPVTCSKNSIKVKEFFLLNPPAQWVNKRYPLLLANMRYIRDGICTGHIRRRVYCTSVYLQVKKDTKYSTRKSIN